MKKTILAIFLLMIIGTTIFSFVACGNSNPYYGTYELYKIKVLENPLPGKEYTLDGNSRIFFADLIEEHGDKIVVKSDKIVFNGSISSEYNGTYDKDIFVETKCFRFDDADVQKIYYLTQIYNGNFEFYFNVYHADKTYTQHIFIYKKK